MIDTAIPSSTQPLTRTQYPVYKDSGVDWLGKIPAHWQVRRIKFLFKEKNIRSTTGLEELLSLSKYHGVIPRREITDKVESANSLVNYKTCSEGDLIINKLQAWNGMLDISKFDGIVSPDYSVYQPLREDINKSYFKYLFRTSLYISEFTKNSTGIGDGFFRLYTDGFFRIPSVLPPLAEQTRIAEFLDRKTAQIDQAIAQKERLIELLNERRQVMIHQAVTRGLDPNVPMKDSGIDWIGEIPAHWGFTQIKKIARTTSGSTPQSSNLARYYGGDIPWVRTTDLNNGELYDVPEKITEIAVRETACKLVPKNTVCVAMYGGPGTIGKHSILRFSGTLNQALCGIMPSKKLDADYLYYYVKFYRPHWMIVAKGSRIDPNISQDEVRKMYITLPPLKEQALIANHITNISRQVDIAINSAGGAIQKLQELKSTLINSAVTGKIKV